jgi:hypothetical protein
LYHIPFHLHSTCYSQESFWIFFLLPTTAYFHKN